MNELEAGRMKCDPSYSTLRGFVTAILPVSDDRVAQRGKLDPDLIL